MDNYSQYPFNCPPNGATELSGIYHRAIKHESPFPEDFFSPFIRNTHPNLDDCERRAISIDNSIDDTIRAIGQMPALGKYVAILELNGGHGLIQKAPSRKRKGHCNWWIPNHVGPVQFVSKIFGPIEVEK